MPWARFGDAAAMHPTVTAPFGYQDWQPPAFTEHDLVNLLFGLFARSAVQSAGYTTDYIVTVGTLVNLAGANWRHWIVLSVRAGYLTPIGEVAGEEAWKLIDDPANLVHIRLREELEWEQQRRKDVATEALVVPVRLRDGDACRYCGRIVVWGDQKGGRGGTYDHRMPGKAAATPEDLRVACRQCNSRRGKDPRADTWMPPLPPPAAPHYGARTAALLAEHGHRVPRTRRTTPRPGSRPDPARRSDPAASRTPHHGTDRDLAAGETPHAARHSDPATGRTTQQQDVETARPGKRPDPARRDPATGRTPRDQHKQQDHSGSADPANRRSAGFESPGRVGDGSVAQPAPARRLSKHRGRRGRPTPPTTHGGPAA